MVKMPSKFGVDHVIRILLIISIFVMFFFSIISVFDHDEIESIHSSWKILNGERIYIDFFQHHHPLFYYFLVPMIVIVGESVNILYLLRFVMFCFFLLILGITYLIAKKSFGVKVALLSCLLLSTTFIFTKKVIEIRPDVVQSLFGLVGLYFWLNYMSGKNYKNLIYSSVSLFISFLFLQKAIVLIVSLFFLSMIEVYRGHMVRKDFFLYLSVFALPSILSLFLISFYWSFKEYILYNWTINFFYTFSFSPFRFLLDSFIRNFFYWVFYIIGLVFYLRGRDEKIIGLLSLWLLGSSFFTSVPYSHYHLPTIPLVSIVSAIALRQVFNKHGRVLAILLVISSLVVIGTHMKNIAYFTNQEQVDLMGYVLRNTRVDDYVYDGDNEFNLFRRDIDYFWYSLNPQVNSRSNAFLTYRLLTGYEYDIVQRVYEKNPVIISDNFLNDFEMDVLIMDYTVSEDFNGIYLKVV